MPDQFKPHASSDTQRKFHFENSESLPKMSIETLGVGGYSLKPVFLKK